MCVQNESTRIIVYTQLGMPKVFLTKTVYLFARMHAVN